MRRIPIKRWMLAASTIMILASATGCSVKRNKCQGNHLDSTTIQFSNEDPHYYITEEYFRRAIRENFFGNHRLVTEEMFLKEHRYATPLDYEVIFNKVKKERKKRGRSINEKGIDEIVYNWSILDFLDYMIAEEGKYQGKYFTEKDSDKIARLFASNTMGNTEDYELRCKKSDNELYDFYLNIEHPGELLYDISELVSESIDNESFLCQKYEKIRVTPNHLSELNYKVKQTYQLKFDNTTINLTNNWEISNKKGQKEPISCRNYQGTLSLEYNNETIATAISEETYEEIAELIAIAVQNKNTKDEFLQQNGGILAEVLGDDYKNLKLGKAKVLQKGSKR